MMVSLVFVLSGSIRCPWHLELKKQLTAEASAHQGTAQMTMCGLCSELRRCCYVLGQKMISGWGCPHFAVGAMHNHFPTV